MVWKTGAGREGVSSAALCMLSTEEETWLGSCLEMATIAVGDRHQSTSKSVKFDLPVMFKIPWVGCGSVLSVFENTAV